MDREKAIKGLECCISGNTAICKRVGCPYAEEHNGISNTCIDYLMADALALLKAQEPITGETSDGYHTFNELYHHRAVLFSVIVANYPDRAWKSKKHHDGTMYDNMFIVGIDTPDGQATYHYDIDPYWDIFKCRVLDNAPEWDGHTPAQAIERIGKLKAQEPIEARLHLCESCTKKYPECDAAIDGVEFGSGIGNDNIIGCTAYVNRWKAQEPRVMKVGDVRNWVNSDRVTREPVVIEIRGGVCAWIIDDEVRELPGNENLSSDLYGKTWRCWTSRPDDATRGVAPWE